MDIFFRQLIPAPIPYSCRDFSGLIFVDANSYNQLLLRFLFVDPLKVAPLIFTIECDGRTYQFTLAIRDYANPEVKSAVLNPDFDVWNGRMKIVKVEPFVVLAGQSGY